MSGGSGFGVGQHLDVLRYCGQRTRALCGAFCRVGKLDSYAVLGDGECGDGEFVVIKLGRIDGSPGFARLAKRAVTIDPSRPLRRTRGDSTGAATSCSFSSAPSYPAPVM